MAIWTSVGEGEGSTVLKHLSGTLPHLRLGQTLYLLQSGVWESGPIMTMEISKGRVPSNNFLKGSRPVSEVFASPS